MAKYIVYVRGTRQVMTEVVVEAKDEDAASDAAAFLVEADRFGSLSWDADGEVEFDDIDAVEECDDNEEVTEIRTRW